MTVNEDLQDSKVYNTWVCIAKIHVVRCIRALVEEVCSSVGTGKSPQILDES